jgi:hypothetical protein
MCGDAMRRSLELAFFITVVAIAFFAVSAYVIL